MHSILYQTSILYCKLKQGISFSMHIYMQGGMNVIKLSVIALLLLTILVFLHPVFAIAGDINGDGIVDMIDVATVAKHFMTTSTSPNWDSKM